MDLEQCGTKPSATKHHTLKRIVGETVCAAERFLLSKHAGLVLDHPIDSRLFNFCPVVSLQLLSSKLIVAVKALDSRRKSSRRSAVLDSPWLALLSRFRSSALGL
jgi:hypothetical protein